MPEPSASDYMMAGNSVNFRTRIFGVELELHMHSSNRVSVGKVSSRVCIHVSVSKYKSVLCLMVFAFPFSFCMMVTDCTSLIVIITTHKPSFLQAFANF